MESLIGTTVGSHLSAGVSYRLERLLGAGGMAVAFFALRRAPDGDSPVVLKVLRADVVREVGANAALMVKKEAVALGRLNENVPPTPFVVRLIDTSNVQVDFAGAPLELPWLAIEYVHGGPEGTTLEQRVAHSIKHTGSAFDPVRAAHAMESLASGLSAIHAVDVIHRDLTPGNVLCCGFGDDEIFKIADFGIARPAGMAATFGGVVVGTPGYAPPEQFLLDPTRIGTWSDLFSLGALTFYLLTGEPYFAFGDPSESVRLAQKSERRRLSGCRFLSPELASRPNACAAIDAALASATAVEPKERPPSPAALASMILPQLRPPSVRSKEVQRPPRTLIGEASTLVSGWSWSARQRLGGDRVIRRVAWDGDGRCLAATGAGLAFWNGTSWLAAKHRVLPKPDNIHFVHRSGAGAWLVGGVGAFIAVYTTEGVTDVIHGPDSKVTLEEARGDINDLLVLVGTRGAEPPLLFGMSSGRWIRPATIERAASISSLAQLDDSRYLVTGRTRQHEGFVALYEPLMWEVKRVETPSSRAYLAVATRPDIRTGVAVGAHGRTVRINGDEIIASTVEGEPDLSAVALDAAGRAWAASLGRLWVQLPDEPDRWRCAWSDSSWNVPIVSVFASIGLVIAMTADGGILEGRIDGGRSS